MSGMKFRVQCSACGATFFSPDRKARICPKCAKKRQGAAPAGGPPVHPRPAAPPKLAAPSKPPKEKKTPRPMKEVEATPEQIEQIEQIYRTRFAGVAATEPDGAPEPTVANPAWHEMVKVISDELWVNRKTVSAHLRKIVHPDVPVSPELKVQIIERYKGYVERGERPPAGRRKTIGKEFGVPFTQVRNIVYEWSLQQFKQSPTPDLSREMRFEIEKLYWAELDAAVHRLDDIPALLAGKLGSVNAYQVSRWFDMLHDDDARFAGVPDVPAETEQMILDAYRQYLAAAAPPEKALHATIAESVGGVTGKQVHKILQRYRNRRRAEYSLR